MMAVDLFTYRPDPYPGSPGYKDRDTSRLAARAVASRATALRDQCLLRIRRNGSDGLTADEAAVQLGESPFSIRPRFTELLRDGKIRDSGLRRRNESGRSAKVWVAV
jgi:predicted ArsR family transcriptional regulator